MPVNTLKSSGGDYTTITAWEAALPATLTAVYELECYSFALTDDTAFSGVTTSSTNYLRLYAAPGNAHDGRSRAVSGTGFMVTSTNTTFRIAVNHIRFEKLDIASTGGSVGAALVTGIGSGSDIRFEGCILHDTTTGGTYTLTFSVVNLNLIMRNCIVYGSQRSIDVRNSTTAELSNNIFWRHAAQLGVLTATSHVIRNNYSGHTGAASNDFWNAATGASNNVSSDTSQSSVLGGTAGISNIAGTAVFNSVTPGSEDFRILTGANALVDAGVTIAAVTTDAIGVTRPQGAAYDVGAFERVVSATTFATDGISKNSISANLTTGISLASSANSKNLISSALTTAVNLSSSGESKNSIVATLSSSAVALFSSIGSTKNDISASLQTSILLNSLMNSKNSIAADLKTGIDIASSGNSKNSNTSNLSTSISLTSSGSSKNSISADLSNVGVITFASSASSKNQIIASLQTAILLSSLGSSKNSIAASFAQTGVNFASNSGSKNSLIASLTTQILLASVGSSKNNISATFDEIEYGDSLKYAYVFSEKNLDYSFPAANFSYKMTSKNFSFVMEE